MKQSVYLFFRVLLACVFVIGCIQVLRVFNYFSQRDHFGLGVAAATLLGWALSYLFRFLRSSYWRLEKKQVPKTGPVPATEPSSVP